MPGGFFVAMRVLGLMSGTSADGVDAVLAEFAGPPRRPRWRLLSRAALPYPTALRQRLIAIGQGQPLVAAEVLELGEALTQVQAEAARACDPEGRAALVGCHGQTVWHRPPLANQRGCSWQLLQGPLLAQLLQRPVVYDFRAADLALSGQGAPLVPSADAALLPAGGAGEGYSTWAASPISPSYRPHRAPIGPPRCRAGTAAPPTRCLIWLCITSAAASKTLMPPEPGRLRENQMRP